MRVVFRCDASSAIGAGHFMRCFALAEAFERSGFEIIFAAVADTYNKAPAALPQGWTRLVVSGNGNTEAEEIAALMTIPSDILFVDHYGRNRIFETACRRWARLIVAVEDLPNRDHDCDVLLDTSGNWTSEEYMIHVPAHCRMLLGPDYVPLRQRFGELRPTALQRRRLGSMERILVSFGAADVSGATSMVLDALDASGLDAQVDVAIPSISPDIDSVIGRARRGIAIHVDAPDMAGLMASADLAIGAAGVTSWERCCLGLPSLVLILADNQAGISSILANAGAALSLGPRAAVDVNELANHISHLVGDEVIRMNMASAAAALVDGCGAFRVVDAIK